MKTPLSTGAMNVVQSSTECGGERVEWCLSTSTGRWQKAVHNVEGQSTKASSVAASILRRVFLPVGYPQSVRPEYIEFQIYDSLQGLSSYLRGVLTTKSILVGAGVGDAEATPMAVALTWILKDGFAIIGSLLFAYLFSDAFECHLKEWRLFADALCNFALTLDLLTGLVGREYFLSISAISGVAKSCCGLIAGATKARVSAHFARDGHLADVISKEQTQETAVCLVGLLLGFFLTNVIGEHQTTTWLAFFFLLLVHQWANVMLVKVLVLDTLSSQALLIITTSMKISRVVPTPEQVRLEEKLWRPLLMWLRGPRVGVPAAQLHFPRGREAEVWAKLQYQQQGLASFGVAMCGLDVRGRIVLLLASGCGSKEILRACMLGHYLHNAMESVPRELSTRYDGLLEGAIPEALKWAQNAFFPALDDEASLESQLARAGWDVTYGRARLGEGPHRVELVCLNPNPTSAKPKSE